MRMRFLFLSILWIFLPSFVSRSSAISANGSDAQVSSELRAIAKPAAISYNNGDETHDQKWIGADAFEAFFISLFVISALAATIVKSSSSPSYLCTHCYIHNVIYNRLVWTNAIPCECHRRNSVGHLLFARVSFVFLAHPAAFLVRVAPQNGESVSLVIREIFGPYVSVSVCLLCFVALTLRVRQANM